MKTLAVLSLVFTLFASPLWAETAKPAVKESSRLGATRTALIKRYGAGEPVTPEAPAKQALSWKLDGLIVEAHFASDVAGLMIVSKAAGTMNGHDAQKILEMCGTDWKPVFQTSGGRWERPGAVAETKGGNSLRLETRAFGVARDNAERAAKEAAAKETTKKF